MRNEPELPLLPDVITVKSAAGALGISERMVHTYIRDGRLPGYKIGKVTAIKMRDFESFQRAQRGRPRTRLPIWRKSVGDNFQYVTLMHGTLKPGMAGEFEQKLEAFRGKCIYTLPGTVGRYIARGVENPAVIQIILIWRSTIMPRDDERVEEIRALRVELSDILEWDDERDLYGRVVLHT